MSDLDDKTLLQKYGQLARTHMLSIVGDSYKAETELQAELRDTFNEIQNRIAANNWQPATVRQKRW